ncbi:MAG: recombinase family protein [Erysipelotrichaceae bacterium]|nr:recombinase family protein [Erysipelotrichaceae bacterium]
MSYRLSNSYYRPYNPFKYWNAAIYIRLSKEDLEKAKHIKDFSNSVENQLNMLKSYVEQHNDLKLIDIYIDDGMTGTDIQRDEFQRLLKDVENGKVNCIVFKDLSRLSRNYYESGYLIDCFFVEHDVRIISLSNPSIDSYERPESIANISVPITNVINDNYCRETSIKIRDVLSFKKSKGLFSSAYCPYGYKKSSENKNYLIIDEPAAEIVRQIYTWYITEEYSICGIARKLNELNVPCPTKYRWLNGSKYQNPQSKGFDPIWTTTTVADILKNQAYLGHAVQGKQKVKSYKIHKQVRIPEEEWIIVKNCFDPIISEEAFNKAQHLKTLRQRIPKSNKRSLLSGLVKCADCGHSMNRQTNGKYSYYICSTYKHARHLCTSKRISCRDLEDVVLASIQSQIEIAVEIKEIIDAAKKNNTAYRINRFQEQALDMKTKELQLEEKIVHDLYPDWKRGFISESQFKRLNQESQEKITRLKEEIAELSKESFSEDRNAKQSVLIDELIKYRNIKTLTRDIVIALIDRIMIHDNKIIDIQFTFKNTLSEMKTEITQNIQ